MKTLELGQRHDVTFNDARHTTIAKVRGGTFVTCCPDMHAKRRALDRRAGEVTGGPPPRACYFAGQA